MQNNFKNFISSLLKKANISQRRISSFTDDESLEQFQIAFTSETFDPYNNYQLIELVGDTIVNYSVIRYLRETFPKIKSIKTLTRLKHNLISKKELALIAEKEGFFEHIRISKEMIDKFSIMSINYKHNNEAYMSLLEDCFEAFIGTVSQVVDSKTEVGGVGTEISYRIIKSILSEVNISLNPFDIFDGKTLYKEICDFKGWKLSNCLITKEIYEASKDEQGNQRFNAENQPINKKMFVSEVYGFINTQGVSVKTLIASYKYNSKVDAECKACKIALKILKEKYNIYLEDEDIYSPKIKIQKITKI